MNDKKPNKKWGIVVIFFVIVILPAIWFLFLNKESDVELASASLTGKWLRTDGPYTVDISSVKEGGELEVAYFNPNPIAGAKGSWRLQNGELSVFIILNDAAYEGSTYELTYNERSKNLVGLFYQAKAKHTYDVYFTKKD